MAYVPQKSTSVPDADGDAGFDLFNSGKDGFQSLFDILTIQKQAMQIAHPVGKKRISFHFFLCNITGTDRAATVGKYNVKVASVITNIKDWCVFWDIFFTDYRDLGFILCIEYILKKSNTGK